MDNQIIQEILNGKREEFGILIDRYYNELFVFVHNQVHDIQLAEDLLQDIFMKIYEKLAMFNPKKASFRTWIYRISNNHCTDYHRKKKVILVSTYELDTISDKRTDVLSEMIQTEELETVFSAMKKTLSKKQYKIIK